ncbi:MAG: Zn-dependent exopeptidase M28 [Roseivirga sp.]|nr:Zn-dependent exopeptidase M28 [Roseivirga sp.]
MLRKSALSLCLIICCLSGAFAFQDDQVTLLRKLTGASPIAEGITLKERYEQKSREYAAEYLQKQLAEFCTETSLSNYSETGINVIGTLEATQQTDEWIVLGAHYDSVKDCPGANDNATGTALVYEVAKYLSQLKERSVNVYIIFFDEEERGLIGSRAFAKMLKEEEVNIVSAHTIDQMGWDEDGDLGIELEMPTKELEDFYRKVAKDHGFDFPIHRTNVTSTDHRAFRELGFDAIGITEEYKNKDTTPHYHRSTDTFETVNLDYLKSTTDYVKKVFEALVSH